VGRVNKTAFDGLDGIPPFQRGTMLMLAPGQPKRKRNLVGRYVFDLTFRFLQQTQPYTWNQFPAQDGNYYRAAWKNGAADVFPSAELADLCNPNYPPPNYRP
jgi:hypothetical protein